MSEKANYFKIGLFVIGAVFISVLAIVVLGGGDLFRQEVMIETYFDESVQGLEVGSPLKLRGITVGQVKQITTVHWAYNTQRNLVMVVAVFFGDLAKGETVGNIKKRIRQMIEQGMRLRLASQGLTGIVYLEADFFEPNRFPPMKLEWEPKYLYIPSAPSAITRLGESLERIMKNLEAINISKVTDHLDELILTLKGKVDAVDMAKIDQQLEDLLSELRRTNRQFAGLVSDPRTQRILTDTSATMAGAKRIVESSERPLISTMADLPQTSAHLKQMARQLESASQDLPALVARMQTAVERIDQLVATERNDIRSIIENMRMITNNLEVLTRNTRDYPAQLFFGAPPPNSKAGSR